MLIVDAHAHIFTKWAGINDGLPVTSEKYGKIKVGNKFVQVMPPLFEDSNSTLQMLLANMDVYGINKAVILSNVGYGYNNEYLYDAVNAYPDRFRALALIDVTGGKPAADELNELVCHKGFCGLKIETLTCFQCSKNYDLDDIQLEPVWECCNDLKLKVMLHISRTNDIISLKNLVKMYNKIKYIVAHFGSETVFCKGTPSMLSFATYKQLIDIVRIGCKEIPPHHKAMILGKNALELFW